MNPHLIKVASAAEQHAHVAQQPCECGGELRWGHSDLHHGESGQWVESVSTVCLACQKELVIEFDVTEAVERGGDGRDLAALERAWPPPKERPYIVRTPEYTSTTKAILAALEAGTISAEEAERRTIEALRACHPLIAGRYRVFGHRRGSMGLCYLCTDEQIPGRSVVAKTIPLNERGGTDVLDALRREAEMWIRIGDHPNIVPLTEVAAQTPDSLVLIMDFVWPGPGGRATLREWIDANAVAEALALRFARQIAAAMTYAIEKVPGLVHGDLKPENILISSSLSALVADFGLARADALPGPRLSGSGLGTKLYLAPECWAGKPPTERSDLYAFGLILCEMLTGRHPFLNARTIDDLRFQHANSTPTVPKGLLGDVATDCVRKDPADRPASFRELLARLGGDAGATDESTSAVEWNNRGTALAALGKHREAIDCYNEALANDPTNPAGWINLGVSWAKLGNPENAMQAYRQAIVLEPRNPHAHASLGALCLRLGEPAKALAACDAALHSDPTHLTALINRADALNSLGRYEEAAATAEQAAAQDASHPHVLFELGTACWRLGRLSKAMDCAKRALALDPQFAPARRLLDLIEKGWRSNG